MGIGVCPNPCVAKMAAAVQRVPDLDEIALGSLVQGRRLCVTTNEKF